jgi:hypothetical protein
MPVGHLRWRAGERLRERANSSGCSNGGSISTSPRRSFGGT